MRPVVVLAAIAALAAVVLTVPVQAASSHKRHAASPRVALASQVLTQPGVRAETGGYPAIYRFNHYQGTDPDSNVRLQLLRDGRNYGH
jgi:hypothetical protein